MRDTQNSLGGFPGVAPLAQYGDEKMRLGWADAGIIVPWTVWKQFGDTQIIEESWNAMDLFMNHINDTKYCLLYTSQKKCPQTTFIPAPPNDSTCGCNECSFMRLNTLEKLYECLKNEAPEITVDPEVAKKAVKPIQRMLEISAKLGL